MVFEDLEPVIGYHSKFYLVVLVSLVWSLDRVTQVVMDGLFHPFHFVEKQYSRTRSEELQGLTSVYTQGRIIFYYSHGICFRGLLIENNCFTME